MIYILIGVVLFGMLLYTYARGGSSSDSVSSKGNAKALALELIEYGNMIETGTNKVMRQCSESDISYYKPGTAYNYAPFHTSYYNNPNNPYASANFSCFVFSPQGGGLEPPKPSASIFNPTGLAGNNTGLTVNPTLIILGAGTDTPTTAPCPACDLVFGARNIKKSVCEEINKILGFGFTITPQYTSVDLFTGNSLGAYSGNFMNWDTLGSAGNGTLAFLGKRKFCVRESTAAGGYYDYVHVMISR